MSHKVRYNGDSRRGLSPALWGDPAKLVSDQELGKCSFRLEDFLGWSAHTVNTNATIQADTGSWKVIGSANTLINPPATVDLATGECGILVVSGATTDNDEIYVARPYEWLKPDTTYTNKIYFEARLKRDVLTDATASWTVGLSKVSDVVAAMLTDGTGALEAAVDFIGFQGLTDDADHVDFIYQATGQTQVVVLANAATLVANTYIKLGFLYDPTPGDGNCLKFFVDGVQINIAANTVSSANIAAATFPNDVPLVEMFGFIMNGTGNACYTSLDWIAAAQYYEG